MSEKSIRDLIKEAREKISTFHHPDMKGQTDE